MKKLVLSLLILLGAGAGLLAGTPQEKRDIRLHAPAEKKGKDIMQSLADRCSTREFAVKKLSLPDLSDLVWAANGINRPESGKRTAPSAMNKQEIKVYVLLKEGAYRYDPKANVLEFVSAGDARFGDAPAVLVLVADFDGRMAAVDAGIVSQNISLFCAGTGLATYPRASFDAEKLGETLKLREGQTVMLVHPVGYFR